jgi:hypothetical protein
VKRACCVYVYMYVPLESRVLLRYSSRKVYSLHEEGSRDRFTVYHAVANKCPFITCDQLMLFCRLGIGIIYPFHPTEDNIYNTAQRGSDRTCTIFCMPVLGVVIDMKSGDRSGCCAFATWRRLVAPTLLLPLRTKVDNDVGYRVVRRVD